MVTVMLCLVFDVLILLVGLHGSIQSEKCTAPTMSMKTWKATGNLSKPRKWLVKW